VSVAFGPYPSAEEGAARDPSIEGWMDILQAVITAGRTLRSEHDVDKKASVALRLRSDTEEVRAFLRANTGAVRLLVRTQGDPPIEGASGADRERGTTVRVVPTPLGPIEVLVALRGLVEPSSERQRIEREIAKIEKEIATVDKKLGAPGFVGRAPKEVVEEAQAQRRSLVEARARLEAALRLVDEL
jgi:valyl-tRNA synthetase